MATLRDIKRRITSVNSTRQITNAMKMVSAAKLARAQSAVQAAQPYAEELRKLVTSLSHGLTGEDHPLFAEREGGPSVVLLYTSDRGLCGSFNAGINKALERHLKSHGAELPEPEIVATGRVGNEFFRKRGYTLRESVIGLREAERVQRGRQILKGLGEQFIAGELGRVYMAYNYFRNAVSQEPRIEQLLPIRPPAAEVEEAGADNREVLFEPSRIDVLDRLLPDYVENQSYLAILNTEAGEHGARMVAMEAATKNAGEMIRSLTLQYNRARQAAITKELIEIVNGAQAL